MTPILSSENQKNFISIEFQSITDSNVAMPDGLACVLL